jgi:hypothetical protein
VLLEQSNPDIIIASETWLDSSIEDKDIFPANFKLWRGDREGRGGGVLVGVRDDLTSFPLPDLNTNCECSWAEIKLKNQSLIVGAFYRSQIHDGNLEYLEELRSALNLLRKRENANI